MSTTKAKPARPGHGSRRKAKPVDGMTDLERKYGQRLDQLKADGVIRSWQFQPVRLLVVRGVPGGMPPRDDEFGGVSDGRIEGIRESFYTPDFRVIGRDGTWSFHETKGFLDKAGDGWLKFKLAVSLHPHPFYMVEFKGKRWVVTRYSEATGA